MIIIDRIEDNKNRPNKNGGVFMAKKNKERKAKSRVEASKELAPDKGNCARKNCVTDDRCKNDGCR